MPYHAINRYNMLKKYTLLWRQNLFAITREVPSLKRLPAAGSGVALWGCLQTIFSQKTICVSLRSRFFQYQEDFAMWLCSAYNQANDLKKIVDLYQIAFPSYERIPSPILTKKSKNTCLLSAYNEKNVFCGFVHMLNINTLTHITYLAVEDIFRGKGYGTDILHSIYDMQPQNIIAVDIEKPNNAADNNLQRLRRKNFYIRNGFYETGWCYTWKDMEYQVLSYRGIITRHDFFNLWNNF